MHIFRQGALHRNHFVSSWLYSSNSYENILTSIYWDLKECEGKPKVNYVTVFERPGLEEFLKEVGEFANLVLFTAGLEGWLLLLNL